MPLDILGQPMWYVLKFFFRYRYTKSYSVTAMLTELNLHKLDSLRSDFQRQIHACGNGILFCCPLLQECHGSPIILDWSSSFKVGRTKRNNTPRCFLDRTAETQKTLKKVTSKEVKSNGNTPVCMYGNNSTKIHQNKISAHTTYNVEGSKSVYMNC